MASAADPARDDPADDGGVELVARRKRLPLILNLLTALAVLAVALLHLGWQLREHGSGWLALMLAAMVGAYAWQAARQLARNAPVLVVRADGLELPGVAADPIPWPAIRAVLRGGRFARNQIDIGLDAALVKDLALGQRALGDSIVARRGLAPGLSILAGTLDQPVPAIIVALLRHLPETATVGGDAPAR